MEFSSIRAVGIHGVNAVGLYSLGECTRGDGCRFSHDMNIAGADIGGDYGGYSARPRGVCYAFQKGK